MRPRLVLLVVRPRPGWLHDDPEVRASRAAGAPLLFGERCLSTPARVGRGGDPWQQFFTDRRLAGVIELALQNNRDLRVPRSRSRRCRPSTGSSDRRSSHGRRPGHGEKYRIRRAKPTTVWRRRPRLTPSTRAPRRGSSTSSAGSGASRPPPRAVPGDAARAAGRADLADRAVASDWLALAADTESLELAGRPSRRSRRRTS